MTTHAGDLLREWRQRRRLSQLDLAIAANVSSRHLSFVETGRSRPTSEMILHLAEHLDVPLRDRNALLLAGGYAPAYAERGLAGQDLAQRIADRFELGLGQATFGIGGRVTARQQQRVAVARRHVEMLGQVQDHLAGRPGAAGLDEAQVPGGDVGLYGQVELAQPAALPPLAQQVSSVHGVSA